MNTISIILITVFINAIVTGVVSNIFFLRYKKEIETSFEASLIDFQTKHVRNQSKIVETLEILFQKYNTFQSGMYDLLKDINKSVEDEVIAKHREVLEDFWNHFLKTEIYLPNFVQDVILEIYEYGEHSLEVLGCFSKLYSFDMSNNMSKLNRSNAEFVEWVKVTNSKFGIGLEPTRTNFIGKVSEYINYTRGNLINSRDKLGKLYKELSGVDAFDKIDDE